MSITILLVNQDHFTIQEGNIMVNFKPTDDHVLIEPQNEEQKTASGLILPTANGEKPNIGHVRAKGDKALDVAVGDKVVFGKYKGEEIELEGVKYLVMRELEIAGIIE